nr:hypothetical protein CFP56_37710 [Quercus suber]
MVSNHPEFSSNGNSANDGTHSRLSKITHTKKIDGAKSTSSFKRTSSSTSKTSPLLKALSILTENGNFGASSSKPSKQKIGNDIQESSNSNIEGNHCTNSNSPDGQAGWVRGGTESSMEALFPLTLESIRNGDLELNHLAWSSTPNPWWMFIIDMPIITKEEARMLNEQRRPLVVPHLDKWGGWCKRGR